MLSAIDYLKATSDIYVEPEYDFDGELVYSPPPLEKFWLTEPERREHIDRFRYEQIRK